MVVRSKIWSFSSKFPQSLVVRSTIWVFKIKISQKLSKLWFFGSKFHKSFVVRSKIWSFSSKFPKNLVVRSKIWGFKIKILLAADITSIIIKKSNIALIINIIRALGAPLLDTWRPSRDVIKLMEVELEPLGLFVMNKYIQQPTGLLTSMQSVGTAVYCSRSNQITGFNV